MVDLIMRCPECDSTRIYKDGFRDSKMGKEQRYLCRVCGYRFSKSSVKVNVTGKISESFDPGENHHEVRVASGDAAHEKVDDCLPFVSREDVSSHDISIAEKSLYGLPFYNSKRQLCAIPKEAKKLDTATENKTVAGISPTTGQNTNGKIIGFLWWMKKQGYADSTVISRTQTVKRLQRLGATLNDPESVKDVIAQQKNWSGGRKFNVIMAYSTYLQMIGASWQPPKYRKISKLPFIPLEAEIDQLIAATSKRVSTFLQILKETGARSGEAYNLKWTDLDYNNCTIRITPEKGSNPRIFKLSPKLVAMINNIQKTTEKIFGSAKIRSIRRSYQKQRKRIANKLGNPRLNQITFHTLRHWKATMEYHKTKDILHVMRLLGNKRIQNTLKYTQLIEFSEHDEYVCKTARTTDEAKELIESGFEYVCDMEQVKLFRKRK